MKLKILFLENHTTLRDSLQMSRNEVFSTEAKFLNSEDLSRIKSSPPPPPHCVEVKKGKK